MLIQAMECTIFGLWILFSCSGKERLEVIAQHWVVLFVLRVSLNLSDVSLSIVHAHARATRTPDMIYSVLYQRSEVDQHR